VQCGVDRREAPDLVDYVVDLRLGEVADRVAAVGATVGEAEQAGDVVEGEPEVLGVFDEPNDSYGVVGIFPVSGRCPRGWGK
jgi:hypothetical protein